MLFSSVILPHRVLCLSFLSKCTYFFNSYFLMLVKMFQTGFWVTRTCMVFHQFFVTQWQSLFTLVSSSATVLSFILISTENWLLLAWWLFALYLIIIGWVIWNNKSLSCRFVQANENKKQSLVPLQHDLASLSQHFEKVNRVLVINSHSLALMQSEVKVYGLCIALSGIQATFFFIPWLSTKPFYHVSPAR